ncbi:DeoR/GlpR family DNA-binding transcription regulator [Brucella pituitosa]|uniref:DeoR/GlpR family DNA-binding transcription regulator n=1 Tax=Brucella pituitosa TaxID=571256 RepID=UPI001FFF8F87|nr:transcriptional regulator [Brucella pituitosa]
MSPKTGNTFWEGYELQPTEDLYQTVQAAAPDLTPKLRGICRLIETDPVGFIRSTARELCNQLGTSEPTLIRFCQRFGYAGLADFRIDLALSLAQKPALTPFGVESNPVDRRAVNFDAKDMIGRKAVHLLEGDTSVLFDNGSSAERLAAHLGNLAPLVIMTRSLDVAQTVLSHKQHQVMLTGGSIRRETMSVTGRLVDAALSEMRFDTFVMGADSVDPETGVSTFLEDEAHQNRAMIEASGRVIVLADKTKFSKPRLHRICAMDRISAIVTDLEPNHEIANRIRERGVRVISTQEDGVND